MSSDERAELADALRAFTRSLDTLVTDAWALLLPSTYPEPPAESLEGEIEN